MDLQRANIEITSAVIRLERLSEECATNQQYALHYCLRELQGDLMRAQSKMETKPSINTTTANI